MTYKERLQKEHPHMVSNSYGGGCHGCPSNYGYGPENQGNTACCKHGTCADCWNSECKDAEKTKDTFTRSDIKPGYLVTVRNGQNFLAMPVGTRGAMILIDIMVGDWKYLSAWTEDLRANPKHKDFKKDGEKMDIVEVRGFVSSMDQYKYMLMGALRKERPILWQRTEVKKMTVAEINAALGYEVEIVAEKE